MQELPFFVNCCCNFPRQSEVQETMHLNFLVKKKKIPVPYSLAMCSQSKTFLIDNIHCTCTCSRKEIAAQTTGSTHRQCILCWGEALSSSSSFFNILFASYMFCITMIRILTIAMAMLVCLVTFLLSATSCIHVQVYVHYTCTM